MSEPDATPPPPPLDYRTPPPPPSVAKAPPPVRGIRLFRLFGINVYLHWSWFVIALIEFQTRGTTYASPGWNIAEYLTLFLIVLMHEFGHALACKSVGGRAERIMLWPLGGIAYVDPPPRPGALLWSIAAGPLVNVVLIPITIGLYVLGQQVGMPRDVMHFLFTIGVINFVLLVFNILPIYPLDGGQILRSLLWFAIGPAKSLKVASIVGLIGAGVIVVVALITQSIWLVVLAVFGAMRAWGGLQQANRMSEILSLPRHEHIHCPACGQSPPMMAAWRCPSCSARFDTFQTGGMCPNCGLRFRETSCPHCRAKFAMADWLGSTPTMAGVVGGAAVDPPR